MTKKHIAIVLVVLLGVGAIGYYLLQRPTSPPIPAPPAISEQEVSSYLKDRGELLMKRRSLESQIVVYEQVLKAAPNSQETRRKLEALRQELSELQ